jgi:hypothetical protein
MREVAWQVRIHATALCRCEGPQILFASAWIEDDVLREQRLGFEGYLRQMVVHLHRLIDAEMLAICGECGGERIEVRE